MKKILLSFLASLVLLFSFAPYLGARAATNVDPGANAATDPNSAGSGSPSTWYNQDFKSWLSKVDDPSNPSEIFGERYTAAQVEWVIYGIFAFFINHMAPPGTAGPCISGDITGCASGIKSFFDNLQASSSSNNNSTQAPSKNMLSLVFQDRPLSGVTYVKEQVQKFSLVPVAHAQVVGFGFASLSPVQAMWTASRDAAYGLFVIAAVVLAFMIMFRVKINPQTVITVQSAIPKIVVALILVTFSYAIAGFLVDLMYVVIGILSVIASSFFPKILGISPPPTAVFSLLTQGNLFGVVGLQLNSGVLGLIFFYLGPLVLTFLILTIGIALIPGIGLLFLIPAVILLIIMIVGLWMTIKTIWSLLKAFVNVLLLTIFAPLQLAAGVIIPSLGFGQWVKSFISNLSVFVVTGALWLLAEIFLVQGIYIGLNDIAGPIATALINPLFGAVSLGVNLASNYTSWPPLLGGGSGPMVGLLFVSASFVVFTMIPKANDIIKSMLEGKPIAYGTSIGELTGPAGSLYGSYAANQIAGGALPEPISRIPFIQRYFRSLNEEQRKMLAERAQRLFENRR